MHIQECQEGSEREGGSGEPEAAHYSLGFARPELGVGVVECGSEPPHFMGPAKLLPVPHLVGGPQGGGGSDSSLQLRPDKAHLAECFCWLTPPSVLTAPELRGMGQGWGKVWNRHAPSCWPGEPVQTGLISVGFRQANIHWVRDGGHSNLRRFTYSAMS